MKSKSLLLVLILIHGVVFAQQKTFLTTTSGLKYQLIRNSGLAENSLKLQLGDILFLDMLYTNEKDSTIFDSRLQGRKVPIPLTKPTFKGGPEEIFEMLAIGDSAVFKISADSFFMHTFGMTALPSGINKGSLLNFYIKLHSITTLADIKKIREKQGPTSVVEAEQRKLIERKTLERYLTDNKITTKPTESGLVYIENVKGKGPTPLKGNKAKLKYVGKFLDGSVFDTNIEKVAKENDMYQEGLPYNLFEFIVGNDEVIKGWEEAMLRMNVGGKATLIIPSHLAYEEMDSGLIKPFSTLIFEVELVDID